MTAAIDNGHKAHYARYYDTGHMGHVPGVTRGIIDPITVSAQRGFRHSRISLRSVKLSGEDPRPGGFLTISTHRVKSV